jgi:hypothetical protein
VFFKKVNIGNIFVIRAAIKMAAIKTLEKYISSAPTGVK